MTYYVYLGWLEAYESRRMKIGQTGRIVDRARQLRINLDCFIGCPTLEDSHKVEDQLRNLVFTNGGIQFGSSKDWFVYDDELYKKTYEALVTGSIHELVGVPIVVNERVNAEERTQLLDEIIRQKWQIKELEGKIELLKNELENVKRQAQGEPRKVHPLQMKIIGGLVD